MQFPFVHITAVPDYGPGANCGTSLFRTESDREFLVGFREKLGEHDSLRSRADRSCHLDLIFSNKDECN